MRTIILIALLAFPLAATADIDLKRMKRDLTIQESVFDRFFETEEGSTTGLYVKDYGVILVAQDLDHDIHVDMTRKFGIGSRVRVVMRSDNDGKTTKTAQLHENENPNETRKKRVTEFLSTYGNAIGQLNDDDRVTVLLRPSAHKIAVRTGSPVVNYRVVDTDSTQADSVRVEKRVYRTPGSRHEIDIEQIVNSVAGNLHDALKHNGIQVRVKRGDDDHEDDPDDNLFEATALKSDIDAYNRNKIDERTFTNRITFHEHKPQPSRDKKIDIMADILSSALKQDSGLHMLEHSKSTGLYQKGIGAIFLVSHHGFLDPESETNPLDALKTTVIETLADYGPTLRDLSSDESIIVQANLRGDGDFEHIVHIVRINRKDKTTNVSDNSKHPNRILFRVSKRDIDAYASKKIDLNAFRKKVEITEM